MLRLKDKTDFNVELVDGYHAQNSASSVPVLDTAGKLPLAQIPTGTTATTVSLGNHTHSYLPLAGGTVTGDIIFKEVTSTTYPALSNKIKWSGGTDSVEMYYQVLESDKGQMVINLRDDANCTLGFAYMGTVKSTIDTNGNFSGNAGSATKWATARTLTIGNKGQSVNGTSNVTWTLAEIGAVAKAGDTMSGPLKINGAASTFPLQTRGIVGNTADGSSIDDLYLQYSANKKIMLGNTGSYEISADGSSYTGNAKTATTLATARTINGTSFNGSANITTANWGTARTLTIGKSGKSVNGSANVSWSLNDIGYQIGGTNLITLNHIQHYAGGNITNANSYYTVSGTTITASNQPTNSTLPGFVVNTYGKYFEYTVSGFTSLSTVQIYFKCLDGSGAQVQAQTSHNITVTNGYFELTFNNIPNTTKIINFGIGTTSSANYSIDRLKLETGNRATYWTPSPEDSLIIGGRNYVIDGKKETTTTSTYMIRTLSDDAKTDLAGKKVTFSFDLKVTTAGGDIYCYFRSSSGAINPVSQKIGAGTTAYKRYSITFTAPTDLSTAVTAAVHITTASGTFYLRNLKVELGERVSSWCYAEEEFLLKTGGNMTGNINFTTNSKGISHNGSLYLRNNGTNTVLSAINANIYFRPKGDTNSTNESYIDTNGMLTIPSVNASSANFGHLAVTRTGSTNGAAIKFSNTNGVLGYIGMTGAANGGLMRWSADTTTTNTILDTGNYTTYVEAKGHTHKNIVSSGNLTNVTGATTLTSAGVPGGVSMYQVYNNGYPVTYGNVLNLNGSSHGAGQILLEWSGSATTSAGAHGRMYIRSKRDVADTLWSDWAQVYTTAHKPTAANVGALPTAGGTMTGNITFAEISGTSYPVNSSKIVWNGGTDGADIYYRLTAADTGQLVFNLRDDANTTFGFAYAGTVKSTIDTNGNFSGRAGSAIQLATARNINRVSFNGTSDVVVPMNYRVCNIGSDNTNLYHLILESGQVTGSWVDKVITIFIAQQYNSESFGIAKINLRTNDAANGAVSGGGIQWLVRSGFEIDALQYNIITTGGNTYMDVFYKSPGTYASVLWYVLGEGVRSSFSSGTWTKNDTNASGTKAYTLAAMQALRSYTSTNVSAYDSGMVNALSMRRYDGSSNNANYDPGKGRLAVREFSSSVTNVPTAHFYHVIAGQGSDTNYTTQLALGMTTSAVYYRYKSSNTWQSWKRLAFTSEIIPLSGTSDYTITGNLLFANSGTAFRGLQGKCGDNDYWRIGGAATGSNAGYMEISTADDGNEPIYVRQYTGVYATLTRTATLLDGSGNTSFPVKVTSPIFDGTLHSSDTRSTNAAPSTYIAGLKPEFKTASTVGINNSGGTYVGTLTFRQYSTSTDWSGGKATQLAVTDNNNLYMRKGDGNGWASWRIVNATQQWSTTITCATWSRLFQFSGGSTVGGSFIVNIRATRGNVVYNPTLMVNYSHSVKANIVQINNTSYSNIQVRAVVDGNGAGYFEMYDNVNSATSSTTQGVTVSVTVLNGDTLITQYTSNTSGATVPSGYTAVSTLTTVSGTYYTGTSAYATRWATDRTLTIGNTGKTVNGSGNVSWSLSEIGALPISGGTMTGKITTPNNAQGITIGDDVTLCDRNKANFLILEGSTATQAGIIFGSGLDTNIYRGADANLLRTDDSFRAAGEIQSTSANTFRSVYGNYGFFLRNDGSNVYFMLTDSGSQYGSYNSLRPLHINCSTGKVTMGNGLSVSNGLSVGGGLTISTVAYNSGYTKSSTFSDTAVQRSIIYFSAASGSNDPGVIYLETSPTTADVNKGVLHLCPSDDATNDGTDYVSIHGSNDAENIKLHTGGNASFSGTVTATFSTSSKISSSLGTSTHLAGNQGTAIINSTAGGTGYNMLAKMNSTNGVWTMGSWGTSFNLFYTANSIITAGTNNYTKRVTLLDESGNSSFPGTVTASSFSGKATTAGTADKLGTNAGSSTQPVYFSGGVPVAGKSYLTLTAVGHAQWGTADSLSPVTEGFMAYWNGRYDGSNSNLQYCDRGRFGTIVTRAYDTFLGTKSDGSYWGMATPSQGDTSWIRTTTSGIIPHSSTTNGTSGIGTASWPFSYAYVNTYYGHNPGTSWVGGMTLSNAAFSCYYQQTSGSYHPALAVKTYSGHVVNLGGLSDNFGFYGYYAGRTANSYDWRAVFSVNNGGLMFEGCHSVSLQRGSDNTYFYAKRTDTGYQCNFGIGSGGYNHGVYSQTMGRWLIYGDGTYTVIPNNVKIGSYRFTISTGAPSSPSTGDVWVDI